MKLGNKNFLIITFYFLFLNISFAEEKITSTPLINVDEIKPSFEILEEENESISTQNLKEKKNNKSLKSFQAILIGLDKITAKSSELIIIQLWIILINFQDNYRKILLFRFESLDQVYFGLYLSTYNSHFYCKLKEFLIAPKLLYNIK